MFHKHAVSVSCFYVFCVSNEHIISHHTSSLWRYLDWITWPLTNDIYWILFCHVNKKKQGQKQRERNSVRGRARASAGEQRDIIVSLSLWLTCPLHSFSKRLTPVRYRLRSYCNRWWPRANVRGFRGEICTCQFVWHAMPYDKNMAVSRRDQCNLHVNRFSKSNSWNSVMVARCCWYGEQNDDPK